ncbi:MAG: adenosine deaminase, partial [Prosthecobacter sp.]|nr:adenosine deaminase [Prosthecobacter sp.]
WVLADQLLSASSSEAQFRDFILITRPVDGLKVFLEKFGLIHRVLSSEARIQRMAFEACQDAYAEGVRVLELRYSPVFIQGERKRLGFDPIHAAILQGIEAAVKQCPMAVGLIGILGREWDIQTATRVTDFFIANQDTVVGMDLANDEANFDGKPFAGLFRKARNAGLHLTVHAGESLIPTSSQSILSALDDLGAERIGHGVQIHKDPALMEEVARRGVILELCPTSNILTKSISSLAAYPIRQIRAAGVRVCINADDPGVFDYDLNHEYRLLAQWHGLAEADFAAMNRDALESSFIPHDLKKKHFKPG